MRIAQSFSSSMTAMTLPDLTVYMSDMAGVL